MPSTEIDTSAWFRSKGKQKDKEDKQKAGAAAEDAEDEAAASKAAGKRRGKDKDSSSKEEAASGAAPAAAGEANTASAAADAAELPPLAEEPSEEYQAEDRPRLLAYSDSDSDVETHIKRVQHHLLHPSDDERGEQPSTDAATSAAAAAAAQQAEAANAAGAQAAAQRQQGGRLQRSLGAAFASVAHLVAPHLTAGFAARLCTLLFLRRLNPSLEDAVELLTLAIPITGAAAGKLGIRGASLPAPVAAVGREAGQLGKAATAFSLARLLGHGIRQQRRRRLQQGGGGSRLRRMRSTVNVASLETAETERAMPAKPPETAAEHAAVYAAEMEEMKRMLRENGIALPPGRFDDTNAELLRYANTCGLLSAKSVAERAAAVEGGVRRIVHTVEWLSSQRFLSESRLKRWDRLVAWKSADARGHPILLVRVGRALQLVKPERVREFMDTVLSQVNRGIATELSNDDPGRERMVVVIDARGASSLALTRHMSLLKHLAVALNQHYPDRLHRLYLLELPLLLRWAVQVVLPLLHPVTREKVVLSSMEDNELPVTVAYLTKRRSVGTQLRRTGSDLTLPGSGGSSPGTLSPTHSLNPPPLALSEGAAATSAATAESALTGQEAGAEVASAAATPPKPGTLEAAWDACQQSASAVRRSLEMLKGGGSTRSSLEVSSGGGGGAGGAGAGASAAQALAVQPASPLRPTNPLFSKSISTPTLAHAASSSSSGGLLFPSRRALLATDGENGAGAAGTPQALGPGDAGGIASHAVALTPSGSFVSSYAVALSPALSRELSEALLAEAAAKAAAGPGEAEGSGAQAPDRSGSGGSADWASATSEVLPEALQMDDEDPRGPPEGSSSGSASASGAAAYRRSVSASSSGSESAGGSRPAAAQPVRRWASVLGWLGGRGEPSAQQGAEAGQAAAAPPQATGSTAGDSSIRPTEAAPGLQHLQGQGQQAGAQQAEDEAGRGRQPGRLASFTSSLGGSSSASTPRTPKGGLTDLPERRRRRGPAAGVTPRKPSLRRDSPSLERSVSGGSGGQLGSHPLRRASSVSWAEELESVKEISDALEQQQLGDESPVEAGPDRPALNDGHGQGSTSSSTAE